jgi:hypothetical protein
LEVVDERLAAIKQEFEHAGFQLSIQESARGQGRGGWFARFRSSLDEAAPDMIARGNTELEAAEVALQRFRARFR